MPERLLAADDLAALAQGAAVLGGGGGGDPHIGRVMAEEALREHGPITLVDLDDVPEGSAVFPVGMMGAPTVMVEKLPTLEQFCDAVGTLAEHLARRPTHVACVEAGGVNSLVPVVAAARLGLPLVDADLMGRAFPELQMVLPTLSGIEATPMSIVDDKGNAGLLEAVSNGWSERMARALTIEMGCSAAISLFAMTGAQLRANAVPATLSLCRRIGETIDEARRERADAVRAVTDVLGGRLLLGDGKVVDVERRTTTGFARGTATIAPVSGTGPTMRLHFQNEHLMAVVDDDGVEDVACTTPDLIVVLETDSGRPVTTEALRFGQRVSVLGAPTDPRWHTPAGLELVGPRYFGYDTDPVRAARHEEASTP